MMLNYPNLWRCRFQGKSGWFCPLLPGATPVRMDNQRRWTRYGRLWVSATSRICTTPSDICANGTGHIRLSPTEISLLISWLRMASQGPYCWLGSADLIKNITLNNPRACSGMCCAKATQCTGNGFSGFTTRCLQNHSRFSARRFFQRLMPRSRSSCPFEWKCKTLLYPIL